MPRKPTTGNQRVPSVHHLRPSTTNYSGNEKHRIRVFNQHNRPDTPPAELLRASPSKKPKR